MGLLKILFPNKSAPREKIVAVPDLLRAGEAAEIRVRRNPQARRISLRVDAAHGAIALTVPWHTSLEEGLRFARGQGEWLRKRLAAVPPRVEFADGASFDFLGTPIRVRHVQHGTTRLDAGELLVGGAAEFASRRVRDWLKREALRVMTQKSQALAGLTGQRVKAVRIRDTRSRWGSAAGDGTLAFSWRLVLAPLHVLDYVVAHEVAHLTQMNHSAAFWALVDRLHPGHESARAWLVANGAKLLRHG